MSAPDEGPGAREQEPSRLRVLIADVLLSQERHVGLAARLLESGASGRGYLLKDRVHDLDLLVSAVRSAARGECHIDSALVEDLVRRRRTEASALDALTPRLRQLHADIAEGRSNAAIARDRFLSVRAVEKHVSEIFGRLGLTGDAGISRRVRATLLYLDAHRR
ncbi:LuxR C-terminal-related transcriptional regulator [Streptomyces sp. NPDC099050]|uniref:LuxR C-terminal-related transcriptional regulator n=1 Tax=Streptomyces sp. NPDC099050 TaxID=3366100 RepID=UPI0037F328C1